MLDEGNLPCALRAETESQPAPSMNTDTTLPTVSCVIPAYNEGTRIQQCLQSITQQDYPEANIEIIVVDDVSEDDTVEIAKACGAKVVTNGEHNIERGKSIGVQASSGEYVLLLDADNALVGRDWLRLAVESLRRNPGACGAQAARFEYRGTDAPANRYHALMGLGDPFAFYLHKRDRLAWYEQNWTLPGELVESQAEYFLVRFNLQNMPTLGSQGYLVRRADILSTNYEPYLFHMEMNMEMIKSGRDTFVILRNSIRHDYSGSVGDFLRKLKRNFGLFLEQKDLRTYRWETPRSTIVVALVSMLTVVRPLAASIRHYGALRDPAWFLHPLLCFIVPLMYLGIYIKWQWSRATRKVLAHPGR
jgi:glycosyltransferase involved in cell wall biosynthesis